MQQSVSSFTANASFSHYLLSHPQGDKLLTKEKGGMPKLHLKYVNDLQEAKMVSAVPLPA